MKLPYITEGLEGIGGNIKERWEDFEVEEVPLYEPCGEGSHLYVKIKKMGWNTKDAQKALSRLFALPFSFIGCAGLKDKHAVTVQTFSIPLSPQDNPEVMVEQIKRDFPFEVLSWSRHKNKLKIGHLLGNRFSLVLSSPGPGAMEKAVPIARKIQEVGLPNFYGGQRFGEEESNLEVGKEVLQGIRKVSKDERRFLLSACQSYLFNLWLCDRIKRGEFEKIWKGDIAKKVGTGGIFTVEDPEAEQKRLLQKEITYTGPIYGKKMRWAEDEPGIREKEILHSTEVYMEELLKVLDGSRRPARIYISELHIQYHPKGLQFQFFLPKGSYATVLLSEFQKIDE